LYIESQLFIHLIVAKADTRLADAELESLARYVIHAEQIFSRVDSEEFKRRDEERKVAIQRRQTAVIATAKASEAEQ